jgi:transposase-like protein
MPTQPNASRADIVAALRQGGSNSRIARELRCDKARVRALRAELGLPTFVPPEHMRTIEEKWALYARPVDGGHMEWTGTRGTSSGTPVLSYKEKLYTAASIAFTIKTGRDPQGYAIPGCGMKHCVAPEHVNDEAGRQQARRELRARQGLGDAPAQCAHGHDQREHGRFEADGTAYCEACKREWRRDPDTMKARTATTRQERHQAIANLLRQGLPHEEIVRRLGASRETIRRIRTDLGLPPARAGRPETYASLEDAYRANTEPVEGGHVRWTGCTDTGSAYICFRKERITAGRLAFTLHHNRSPVGRVEISCDMAGCVAGAHLTDRRIRDANRRADTAFEAIFGGAA